MGKKSKKNNHSKKNTNKKGDIRKEDECIKFINPYTFVPISEKEP